MSQPSFDFNDTTPEFELLKNAGKQVDCSRCGAPCMVASKRNLKARPFQHGDGENGGFCGNCAATEFLQSPAIDISYLLPEGTDVREALGAAHVQECFANILKAGMSDLKDFEVDWSKIIENWHLPFRKRRGKSGPKKVAPPEDFEEWADVIM